MSKPIALNVPKQHLDILIYFFGLPNEIKEKILFSLNNYDGDLSPKKLVEYLAPNIEIEKKKLLDLSMVFLTLLHSINSYTGSIDEFASQIGESLIETYPEETFNQERANELKRLLENGSVSSLKAKIMDLMSDTNRVYIEAKILQDLRTSFGDNGQVLGSAIIHNLKITTQEGRKRKDYFISMDNKDLESLSKEIKKAQDNSKNISSTYINANIIDL